MKKIKILFACTENSFRSQIAEGIAKKYYIDKIEAYSAGSKPIGHINENAVKVLEEIGIDIKEQYSKGFFDLDINEFDYLITMGCNDVCPFYPSKKILNWDLPDIKNGSFEKIRELREEIRTRIDQLMEEENE